MPCNVTLTDSRYSNFGTFTVLLLSQRVTTKMKYVKQLRYFEINLGIKNILIKNKQYC